MNDMQHANNGSAQEPVSMVPTEDINPHTLWKQILGLGIASIISYSFHRSLAGIFVILLGMFTFLDAWTVGIYKKKGVRSLTNNSPMGWGIFMVAILIIGYPLYLIKRNNLKTKDGTNVFWILIIIFGGIALLSLALQFGGAVLVGKRAISPGPTTTSSLWVAAAAGDTEKVRALLAQGADVNAKANDGKTALWVAALGGHTDIVHALLAKGADVDPRINSGDTPLMAATMNGHTDIVHALLAKGADVNAKDNIVGGTALMSAALGGHTDIVHALLAKGADVNAKTNDGKTALMFAAEEGHTEIVHALLAKGADVNAKTNVGKTVLMWAKQKDHKEIVQLLKKAGAEE